MRKSFKYILAALICSSSLSCKKFLDKTPYDLSPVGYYETDKELTAGLAGVYDRLGALYGGPWLYRLGLEADEGYYARNNLPQGPQNFNFSASHNDVASIWRTLYEGIFRANFLLENIDKNTSINENFRNQVRGEALALRAHYYFMLVQQFGGVPLLLEATKDSNENMDIPKSSAKEIYEQVLADFKAAESLVLDIGTVKHGGRMTKSAVRGMLARVCLYMAGEPLKDQSKYAEAKEWAAKVINDASAGHKLNPDFTEIFKNYARDQYDIGESIWEVEFWGNRTDTYTETGFVGFANGPITSNALTGNGFGGVKVTAKLYYKYAAGDERRDWTIANFVYVNSGAEGNKNMITATTEGSIYNRETAKWRREYETLRPKATGQTPQNFPLLRYSDILLMYAEADFYAANKTVSAQAVDYINQVRRRAYGKLKPEATDINEHDLSLQMDASEFETAIRDERMREFAFEQQRKFDLIRWGTFIIEMRAVVDRMNVVTPNAANLYAKERFVNAQHEKHLIWPIPSIELTMNKAMVQNPGW
ncbi:RagB/SusD family nutrient uptake outer membrane protein [Sphingobacterium sp. DK4209]|uniref:RagB/SusD family nutrient uptake outer membrane protein n=1 Tax=Sphingobacterium zhuxiongii TaxID=2662364 RepID=A0A5Q0QAY7_9SPHI|nr:MULTISPECIES: RagB/SusD family nutrient uptake outer membrane protein [unclassified Sphingobacterium]MVZ67382.1 RagB/SusD family nutrient uptake outer membrane protein [Sphingobacterium sp. DK4209]QGA26319.1 RagB/SusD family nutrient uptake outer membrane protein [Sphingobacterium sp. dk4302]